MTIQAIETAKLPEYVKTDIKGATTIDEVLDRANAKWNARTEGMITNSGIDFPEHFGIVRDDNNLGLGVVKGRYTIINNHEAFSFFDHLVQANEANYDSYSEVDGGKKVIVTARTPKIADVRLNDPIQSEIKMINSFDGSTAFQVIFSVLRLVCTNGMTRKSKENSISIRHTKSKDITMQNAHKVLLGASANWEKFLADAQTLANKALDYQMVTDFIGNLTAIRDGEQSDLIGKPVNQYNEVENYFSSLLSLKADKEFSGVEKALSGNKYNEACEIANLTFSGKGNNGTSVWDLYNGATEYYDHHKGSNALAREKSSIIGNGANKKSLALDLALAF